MRYFHSQGGTSAKILLSLLTPLIRRFLPLLFALLFIKQAGIMTESRDLDEYYNEEDGDFLSVLYGGDEFFDPGTRTSPGEFFDSVQTEKDFPPSLLDYVDSLFCSRHPDISFNYGWNEAWIQAQKEVNFIRNKLGLKDDGLGTLFRKLYGEDSVLFSKFRKIGIASYERYCLFMATFYFECRFSTAYQKLWDDKRAHFPSESSRRPQRRILASLNSYPSMALRVYFRSRSSTTWARRTIRTSTSPLLLSGMVTVPRRH